jgi:hypothetical protein
MSTLALQLDQALTQLDPAKRAELERIVSISIHRLTNENQPPPTTAAERHALLMSCAGSIPDFPEDFEEMAWETDRDPLL